MEQVAEDKRTMQKDESNNMITAVHLHKAFEEKVVLDDINFDLPHKKNYVILGRSGSGKSVLLKCIVGLITHDKGELHVLGKDITHLEDDEKNKMRRRVGYLFQGGALYDAMSVRENMEFPLKRSPDKPSKGERIDLIEETLGNVGLLEAIDKMPSELSGGMKKRIALARTLILKPEIMLYDEPTTGLDAITSNDISELMLEMREKYNISSLTITHDMSCARITGDKIFILQDGNFKREGKYEELKNDDDDFIRSFFDNK